MQAPRFSNTKRIFRSIAKEVAVLPGVQWVARPAYRRLFQQRRLEGNDYYGVYETYAQALADAPPTLPSTYDIPAAGRMYRDRHSRIIVSDYPLVHWLSKLFAAGQRRVFDLGGHIGVSYYGFHHYIDYPNGLQWTVHDTPATVATGREWAKEHDPDGRLAFSDSPNDADGYDILMSNGVLQYLDYTLPELLGRLHDPPKHVLINLTPMHPSKGYFTLQHIGIAICPYRVMAVPELVEQMEALGYRVVEHWESFERHLHVPFEPRCTIDSYHGFYFRRGE